jgi:4,5-dihydroxyphthalate decarboxylase
MAKLELSVAIGNYDRNRPLIDGQVMIDGVSPVFMTLSPEEIFFRAMRHEAFDICELSLSSFILRTARGDCPYVGIPAFVSRGFRHTSIIVRSDSGIRKPSDLAGRRVGLAEWQLTANVWARAFLQDDFGLDLGSVTWVRGGIEEPGRPEKVALSLPESIRIEDIGPNKTLGDMLVRGEIDAFIGPRPPKAFLAPSSGLRWLFDDPQEEALAFYRRTAIFPVMHLIGLRRTIADRHPWLPAALLKAFEASKKMALDSLADTSATKVTLPFIEEHLTRVRRELGADFWSYGYQANEHVLEYFLRHHAAQGLSHGRLQPADLFHPSTFDSYKI